MDNNGQSNDMDLVVLKCGLKGAVAIVVISAVIGWSSFILTERIRLVRTARELQGNWKAGEDAGVSFNFSHGLRGTVTVWGDEIDFTEDVRVVWRQGEEALLAFSTNADTEEFYLIRFSSNPDTLLMQGEGENTGTLLLIRETVAPSQRRMPE